MTLQVEILLFSSKPFDSAYGAYVKPFYYQVSVPAWALKIYGLLFLE
jgi:hypothetical protein